MLLIVAWSVVPNYKFNCNAAKICVVLFLRVLLDSFARGGFYLLQQEKASAIISLIDVANRGD